MFKGIGMRKKNIFFMFLVCVIVFSCVTPSFEKPYYEINEEFFDFEIDLIDLGKEIYKLAKNEPKDIYDHGIKVFKDSSEYKDVLQKSNSNDASIESKRKVFLKKV